MSEKQELIARCNHTLQGNWLKIFFAAAVFIVGTSLAFSFLGIPAMALAFSPAGGLFAQLIMAGLLFIMYSFLFTLLFGFFVLIIRFFKNEYVTLGYLFYGFRNWQLMARCALFFMLLLVAASLIMSVLLMVATENNPDFITGKDFSKVILPLILIVTTLFLIFVLPFVYVLFYLYEAIFSNAFDGKVSVIQLIKKSATALKGKKRFLISLCFSFVWKEVSVSAVLFGFTFFLLLKNQQIFLASRFSYINSIILYLIWIKVITACTVFFYTFEQKYSPENPAVSALPEIWPPPGTSIYKEKDSLEETTREKDTD